MRRPPFVKWFLGFCVFVFVASNRMFSADQREAAHGLTVFAGPLSLISVCFQNGPERSRARRGCAAKRTLEGEDRSENWRSRERGPGVSGGNPLARYGAAPHPHAGFACGGSRPRLACSAPWLCSCVLTSWGSSSGSWFASGPPSLPCTSLSATAPLPFALVSATPARCSLGSCFSSGAVYLSDALDCG